MTQTPHPGLAFANAQPPRRFRALGPHPPPHTTTPHCCFTQRARNRATIAQFQVFGPNPAPLTSRWRTISPPAASAISTPIHHLLSSPYMAVSCSTPETEPRMLGFGFLAQNPPCVGERIAHPPPPRYQPAPTAPWNHSTLPFHAACPKPSHDYSVSGFWPKPCPPASHWRMCSPPAASMISTPTQHLLSSPYTAVSCGMPKTRPPAPRWRMHSPATPASMLSTCTHHLLLSIPATFSIGTPESKAQQLGFPPLYIFLLNSFFEPLLAEPHLLSISLYHTSVLHVNSSR